MRWLRLILATSQQDCVLRLSDATLLCVLALVGAVSAVGWWVVAMIAVVWLLNITATYLEGRSND